MRASRSRPAAATNSARWNSSRTSIDDDLLRGYLRFSQGQPFSPEALNSTQFALEDSNYFSSVVVTPGERDPATLTVPVTIHVEPIKRDRYAVSAGYGTDTGIRGQFTWDNRLINTNGHRSRVELTASEIRYEALARYVIPVGDPSLEKLEFSLGYSTRTSATSGASAPSSPAA